MSSISKNIKKFRESKGLTQAELAKLLKKSTGVIGNWETGINRPDVDSIRKMCKIFEIDANTFFDWEKELSSTTKTLNSLAQEDIEIFKKFQNLTQKNKYRIEGNIDDYLRDQKQDLEAAKDTNYSKDVG